MLRIQITKTKIFIMLFFSIFFSSCKTQELKVEKEVDIQKYLGTWYEIARLPNSFEKGLDNVSATYSLKSNGKIKVLNKGVDAARKTKEANGVAWLPNEAEQAKLKVSFFWPFAGKYWIVRLDKNYQYVLVGEPTRKYLWILARTKTLDENIYLDLLKVASENGFDISKIIKIKQTEPHD